VALVVVVVVITVMVVVLTDDATVIVCHSAVETIDVVVVTETSEWANCERHLFRAHTKTDSEEIQ
jgi:hypothetical protein